MKKCAIYTRVSTSMQAEVEYNSCEAQRDRIFLTSAPACTESSNLNLGRLTGFEPVLREPQSLVLPLHHSLQEQNLRS